MKMFRKIVSGFSLIELLVVVAIIGLLSAFLLPTHVKAQGGYPLGSDIISDETASNVINTLTATNCGAASCLVTSTSFYSFGVDANNVTNQPSQRTRLTIYPDKTITSYVSGAAIGTNGVTNAFLANAKGFPLYPSSGQTTSNNFVSQRPALLNGIVAITSIGVVSTNVSASNGVSSVTNSLIDEFHQSL